MSHPLRNALALAGGLLATLALASPANAQEVERRGGRFGASVLGGFALGANLDAMSTVPAGFVGPTLRFGGAFTDRFHLLGEFTLAVLPTPSSLTAFHAALSLGAQGYIGPRLFVRGAFGAGWVAAVANDVWALPLPGPRLSGAVGYDLWRHGEQSFSLALETQYTFLFNGGQFVDRMYSLALGVGFDWY